MTGESSGARRPGRGRWVAMAAAAAVVTAAVLAGTAGAFGGPRPAASTDTVPRTSTATATRQSLTSQTQVEATLGDSGSYSVVNQAAGTLTALPAIGQVVHQGHVLYQVSGIPVVLLYGSVPAWRDLSEGVSGPDVAELNADLVKLGCATRAQLDPHSDFFGAETVFALEGLQARLGVTVTGELALGQAVFAPGAIQVTGLGPGVVLGGPAQAGAAALTATSTTPVVTIALDASEQSEVKDGEQVTITLPSGHDTTGVVSQVSTIATAPSSSDSSSDSVSPDESSSPGSPTITVEVTPTTPKALGRLSQAPVAVTITSGRVPDALVVPVVALLAQASGGYAVEVVSGGRHHLVAVTPGLFDDAAGLVQVTGTTLTAGQRVVVPAV
jgi:hypothetical protein